MSKAIRPPSKKAAKAVKTSMDTMRAEMYRAFYADALAKTPAPARVDVRREYSGPWLALIERFGSAKALGSFLETTEMSVNRWARGESAPSGDSLARLRGLSLALGIKSPV